MTKNICKKVNDLCNKDKKRKEGLSDLENVKNSINKEVLNTTLKSEEKKDIDLSIYFKKED